MTSEKRYYRLGAIILLAGLLAATAVYLRTVPADDDGAQDGNGAMVRPGRFQAL